MGKNRGIQQQQQQSKLVMQRVSQSFSGPVPPPDVLARYNDIIPNAAERILIMAEKQQEHRQDLESRVVIANTHSQTYGLAAGFVVAMTAVGGGIWLAAHGEETTGLVSIISALAALVGVFVYGRHKQKEELKNKAKPLD